MSKRSRSGSASTSAWSRSNSSQPTVGGDLHPALANVGSGEEVGLVRIGPGDALGDRQVADRKLVHADVEVGQDRRVGIAGAQCRQAEQRAAVGGQFADVEPARNPARRPPVEIDQRQVEKLALGIGQRDVVQPRLAVEIAVDPPDADRQPRSRRDFRDPVDDPAVPDRAVEHRECGDEQQHQPDDTREQPLGRLAAPCEPANLHRNGGVVRRGGVGWRVDGPFPRHQKAWPSET